MPHFPPSLTHITHIRGYIYISTGPAGARSKGARCAVNVCGASAALPPRHRATSGGGRRAVAPGVTVGHLGAPSGGRRRRQRRVHFQRTWCSLRRRPRHRRECGRGRRGRRGCHLQARRAAPVPRRDAAGRAIPARRAAPRAPLGRPRHGRHVLGPGARGVHSGTGRRRTEARRRTDAQLFTFESSRCWTPPRTCTA